MANDVAEAPAGNTTSDIFEHLSNIPEKEVPKADKKEVEEKEPEKDILDLDLPEQEEESEEEELEPETGKIDLDEEEEKEENELDLAKIPTGKQLKEKYPNIFKDFPAVERIFYREKEFAQIFPTVKDAREARASLNDYNNLQADVLNGDITPLLNQVKTTDPKAFDKIAKNFIESLGKVDANAIVEPSRFILKTTIANLNQLANQSLKRDPNNKRAEQLQIATELIHEALFNTNEVSGYERVAEEKVNPEREAITRERAELDNRKFGEAHGKITSRFSDLLNRAIDKNIDPRNSLSSYVKSKVSDDVRSALDRQMIDDKRFEGIVKKLYERARSENYSQQSLDNILTALKNKAASILPEIIRAKKGEALKGSSSRNVAKPSRELSRKEDDGEDATTRNSSRATRSERKSDSDNGPQPGESAFDYLNRKLGD